MARAFVLSFNGRAAFAVILVAMSVAYAVLTAAAAGGLGSANEAISDPALAQVRGLHAAPGLAPFDRALVPEGGKALAHAVDGNVTWGTIVPWPYGDEVVPQPYAPAPAGATLPVGRTRSSEAPWTWVLVPPAEFERMFPAFAGRATIAIAEEDVVGLARHDAPAVRAFYDAGARQVVTSVHLVVAAMGLSVAILAAGVLQLEVLARERDLATLESLGGRRVAKRAIVLRAVAISGAGVVLGLVVGILLTIVAGRAIGGVAFRVDPLVATEASLISFTAGVLAGSLSGLARLRAPLAQRLGRRGTAIRPFRGPMRFLLVTPRIFPTALVAAIVISSVSGVVLAAASVPYQVFEPGEDVQVLGRTASNPFRGSADRFLGEHATLLPNVNGSSPETLAPTIVAGKPVIVRGVHVERWRAVDPVVLVEGEWPDARGEALVGVRAARVLGIGVGDTVTIPGAYRATLQSARIVGVHSAPGLLDDEIVVELDVAGDLAGLPAERVNMVRLKASEGAMREALAGNLLVVTDLTLVPAKPIPHTTAVARVELLNLAEANVSRKLDVRVNGVLVASGIARAAPREDVTLEIPFPVPAGGGFRVEVNPTLDAQTSPSTLDVLAPERVAVGTAFDVQVLTPEGTPVGNATVAAGERTARTAANGTATLLAASEGQLVVSASEGERQGGALVYVVDPAQALGARVRATVASVTTSSPLNATHVEYALSVTFVNVGAEPFAGEVNATVGNATVGRAQVRLAVEARATVPLAVRVPEAQRTVAIAGLSVALPASGADEVPLEQRPRTLDDVLTERRASAARAREAQELRAEDFIQDVFAGLEPSVAVVVLATFFHASAGVSLAVLREMREREDIRATLHDLGATQDQIALRAVRDAAVSILPGLVLGCAATWIALRYLGNVGFPAAFGHTIPATQGIGFYLRLVGGLALVAILTAFWAAYRGRVRAPRQVATRRLDELTGDPP